MNAIPEEFTLTKNKRKPPTKAFDEPKNEESLVESPEGDSRNVNGWLIDDVRNWLIEHELHDLVGKILYFLYENTFPQYITIVIVMKITDRDI